VTPSVDPDAGLQAPRHGAGERRPAPPRDARLALQEVDVMTIVKEFQFPVSVRWRGGRLARAESDGKEGLEVATPPEFRTGVAGYWTPEDLFVAAVASCFSLTLAAVAERREVPLLDASVSATGHMSHRDDGRFGFTVVELDATVETLTGYEDAVRSAAQAAEERCLVTQALDVPVHVTTIVETVDTASATTT
jgi:organic hydroperoxide reductase OsmC/OhrA